VVCQLNLARCEVGNLLACSVKSQLLEALRNLAKYVNLEQARICSAVRAIWDVFVKQKQNGEKMQNHKNSKERLNARIYAEDKALKSNFARFKTLPQSLSLARVFSANSDENLPSARSLILPRKFNETKALKSSKNHLKRTTFSEMKVSNLACENGGDLARNQSPILSLEKSATFQKFSAEQKRNLAQTSPNGEKMRVYTNDAPGLNLPQKMSNPANEKGLNLSKSRALLPGQNQAQSFRASSSQNQPQILNANKSKIKSESPKNRVNSVSLNAAKSSSFTSGSNLRQTAPSAADQDALLAEFKAFLNAHLPSNPSFHPCFDEALSYTLKSGGKHFRAMLVAGVVAAVRPERKEAAFHVALAFETMHSYSLIHDDLPAMDDSDLRRGQPSLHVKFDEVTAILAGDALNTHAFYQIARAPLDADTRIKCVEILSRNAGIYGMALGQAVDCYFENQKLGLEELKFLHIHKTARLIAASLQAGCVVAGLDEAEAARIYDIGLDLGLAFQIADDIIDATQSAETAGKPTHNDGAKNSFTNLLGVEGAVQAKNELIAKIERELGSVHTGIRAIVTGLIGKHLR